MLTRAFISSEINYSNSLLTGLPEKTIKRLQLIHNTAARVLTKTRGTKHIPPLLKSLHTGVRWIIEQIIKCC